MSSRVPDRVSPHGYNEVPQHAGMLRDAETRSGCPTAAPRTARPAIPVAGVLTAPSALFPSSLRTEGTKGPKAPDRRLRAVQARQLPELLSPAQVAEFLGVCRATIYKLTTTGQLAHIYVGSLIRIPRIALAAYLSVNRAASR